MGETGHTGAVTALVCMKQVGVLYIARSNCGGAVAGVSTREASATPSSRSRASACLRVEWRLLMVRRPPQGSATRRCRTCADEAGPSRAAASEVAEPEAPSLESWEPALVAAGVLG